MKNFAIVFLALVFFSVGLPAQSAEAEEIPPARLRPFKPLPPAMHTPSNPVNDAKVKLGRMLYYEPRLSKSHTISCNSCHDLETFGVDNEPTSEGHLGKRGDRNSPTVYNAAGHLAQFWDGRAPDVEEQAKGPVLNPVEMALPSESHAVAVLKSMPEYVELFKRAFPDDADPITFHNFALAVGAFERGLVTPSRWDRYLAGETAALSAEEKAGFKAFSNAGCPTCHMGVYVGGSSYQKLGLAKTWPSTADLGRYQVTKVDPDKLKFKVPSLRNIEKTGPYFHHGKVATLEESIKLMAEYELGKKLSDKEVGQIVAFLKTLTGEIPREYIRKPQLPKSTAQTPKPDLTE